MLYDILYLLGGLIAGLVAGFFIAKKLFQKQLKELSLEVPSYEEL